MTVTQTTVTTTGARSFERERNESLRVARGILLGVIFSSLFWTVVVAGSRQVGALLGFP